MQVQGLLHDAATVPRINLLSGLVYDGSGNFSLSVSLNKNFELTFGASDFSGSCGAQNFQPPPVSFLFTAHSSAFFLVGVPNALITAQLYQLN